MKTNIQIYETIRILTKLSYIHQKVIQLERKYQKQVHLYINFLLKKKKKDKEMNRNRNRN